MIIMEPVLILYVNQRKNVLKKSIKKLIKNWPNFLYQIKLKLFIKNLLKNNKGG